MARSPGCLCWAFAKMKVRDAVYDPTKAGKLLAVALPGSAADRGQEGVSPKKTPAFQMLTSVWPLDCCTLAL